MLEFSSISVSSYDAASLADKLTEKSADGWDVVAIVPAGTNVTAYLSRTGGGVDASDAESAHAAESTPTGNNGAEWAPSAAVAATLDEPVETTRGDDAGAEETAPIAEPTLPEQTPAERTPEPAAVEEPAGWAVAPESASTASTSSTSDALPQRDVPAASTSEPSIEELASSIGETSATDRPSTIDAGIAPSSTSTGGYESSAATAGATAGGAATSSAAQAPAGWYADPSTRYELRYWDGGQWTEHVSRAGQQYTDPPVA